MKNRGLLFRTGALAACLAIWVHADPAVPRKLAEPEPGEELSGGGTTAFDATSHAYSLAARNLPSARRRLFMTGHAFFNDTWVEAPSSTTGRDGLGPLFNANSCSGCHPDDGRGRPDVLGEFEPRMGLLFRLSVPGPDGPVPHPGYGGQLQNRSINGVPPEGQVDLADDLITGSHADRTPYHLHKPVYTFKDLNYGELGGSTMVSPRLAPAVFGMGLLAAIPEATLLANADPDDADGDGISGRPNWILQADGTTRRLGRFGWKANVATLREQIAEAFNGDLGISSSPMPHENATATQGAALAAASGGNPELDDHKLERVEFYMHTLAVPARRDWRNPEVLRGKQLFHDLKCAVCHVPRMKTGELEGYPELGNQVIFPYTDMLLHDMGEDLADNRPDHSATGREWRTPPLWGLGLLNTVNGHTRLLHDGRARVPAEAILWHGGEAESSREAFKKLPSADRDALLSFLNSL